MDEQWSFVCHKKQQRWLWYAWQPHLKVVLAYAFGPRADSTLTRLLQRLTPFNLALYCTDDWGAYERLLPEDKHYDLVVRRWPHIVHLTLLTSNAD